MQLSILFVFLTLVLSLAALPIYNPPDGLIGLESKKQSTGLAMESSHHSHSALPAKIPLNQHSLHKQGQPGALRVPKEEHVNRSVTGTSTDDPHGKLEPRRLGKLVKNLQKIANSKVGKAIGKAFGDFDWRPQWQKDLQKAGLRLPECKRKCWMKGNSYSKEFRAQALAKGVVIP